MRKLNRVLRSTIALLFTPMQEIVRRWQHNDLGSRFMIVLIEMMLLIHLMTIIIHTPIRA